MSTVTLGEYKGIILGGFAIITYFLWMDVALYYQIQARQVSAPVRKPLNPQSAKSGGLFSPFTGLTLKMMMIDPANHYIHTPAATIFEEVTNFSETFSAVTPNMISGFHVVVAVIAAKFIASSTLRARKIGVLLFEFRAFLDCLDGVVYRARIHQTTNISNFGSIGYFVDGVTDAAGSVALMLGCFVFLRNSVGSKSGNAINSSHLSLRIKPSSAFDKAEESSSSYSAGNGSGVSSGRIWGVLACVGLQLVISAGFWDRYISGYHLLLENPQATDQQIILQNEVLKSSLTWIIIWFWRIANAHALLEMILFSIFVDKLWTFVTSIQFIGFVAIAILILLTEVHYHDVSNYIGKLAPDSTLPSMPI